MDQHTKNSYFMEEASSCLREILNRAIQKSTELKNNAALHFGRITTDVDNSMYFAIGLKKLVHYNTDYTDVDMIVSIAKDGVFTFNLQTQFDASNQGQAMVLKPEPYSPEYLDAGIAKRHEIYLAQIQQLFNVFFAEKVKNAA